MIAIIDYGAGNLRNVEKAFRYLEAPVEVVTDPKPLDKADALVLPGVGAFDDCVNALVKQDLFHACRAFIQSGRPFLGICVGYQVMFERSAEFNSQGTGLSIFKGEVVRFDESAGLKIPQIGWNQLEILKPECPLFRKVPNGSYVYYVHSFFPNPVDSSIIAAQTTYGKPFAGAVARENVYGTQFHPEKSQHVGLQILRNFVDLVLSGH